MANQALAYTTDHKRRLAEWLLSNDPQTLQALTTIAQIFGRARQVAYRHHSPVLQVELLRHIQAGRAQ